MSERTPTKRHSKKTLEAAAVAAAGLVAGSPIASHAESTHLVPPNKPAIVEKAAKKNQEHSWIRHGEKGTLVTLAEDKRIGAISGTEHISPAWPWPDSWAHVGEIAERIGGAVTLDVTIKIPEQDLKHTEDFLHTLHINVTLRGSNHGEVTLRVQEIHAKTFTETGYLNPEQAEHEQKQQIKYAIEKAVHTVCSFLQYPAKAFSELFDSQELHVDGITIHKATGETSPEAEEPESVIPGHVDEKNIKELGPRRAQHLLDRVKEYCDEHGITYAEDRVSIMGTENQFTPEEFTRLEKLAAKTFGTSNKDREDISVFRLVKAANNKALPDEIQKQVEPILERKRNAVTVMTPDGKLLTVIIPLPILLGMGLLIPPLLRRLRPRGMEIRFTAGYGVHDTSTPHRDLAHHGRIAQEHRWRLLGPHLWRFPTKILSVHGLHLSELSTSTIRQLREEFNNDSTMGENTVSAIQETIEEARAQGVVLSTQDAYWIYHASQDAALRQRIAHEIQESLAQLRGVSKDRTFILLDNPATEVLSTFNDDFQQQVEELEAQVVREIPLFVDHTGLTMGTGRLSVMIPIGIEDMTPEYAAALVDEIEERNIARTESRFNITTMRHDSIPAAFSSIYLFTNGDSVGQDERLAEMLVRPLADRIPTVRNITIITRSAQETQRVAHHAQAREIVPTDEIPERVLNVENIRLGVGVSCLTLPEDGTVSDVDPWPRTRPREEGGVEYRRQNRNPLLAALRRFLRRP